MTFPRFASPAFIRWSAKAAAEVPGAAERILMRHTATADGLCRECSREGATWWPCTPVNVAFLARVIACQSDQFEIKGS